MIQIHIKDTGVGISQEIIDKLFKIDGHSSTKGTMGEAGTGLGLIICNEFIIKNKGSIKVSSAINEGSCFTIEVPKGKTTFENIDIEDTAERINNQIDFPFAKIPMKEADFFNPQNHSADEYYKEQIILLIEDNIEIRNSLASQLSTKYTIYEASNGREGLLVALEIIPDIIISDVMIPEINGMELCIEIKKAEATCHIPVILITALSDDKSKINGFNTGADDYISKPFKTAVLISRIANLLDSRKKLKEIFKNKINYIPTETALTSTDEKFMIKAIKAIEANFKDPEYNSEKFVNDIGMSRTQVFRKLKALTDQSASNFIRTIRLKKAAQLLEKGADNISEVAFSVGFNNIGYFATCFKEQFGTTPSDYKNK